MKDGSPQEVETDAHERRVWFRENILPHEAELRNYVRRIGRGRISVEDHVHDTFVRIMVTANWRQVAQPLAFMRAIARNLLIDARRREKVVTIEFMGEYDDVVDETPTPETVTVARDELLRVMAVVEELPLQQRRVFNLRKLQGLSPSEIAEQLGLSVSTVEKHLVRALRFCSDRLARHDEEDFTNRYGK